MAKVSIVIPVYNMQKYLNRCMESIFAQTLEDIEVILVDDGSTDESPKMCDSFAQSCDRVRCVHKENGGLTSAWKEGSRLATGEYIGYIDSDDFIESEMFERMYERAVRTDADIVCCGLRHLYESSDRKPWTEEMITSGESLTREDIQRELFPGMINDGRFMGRCLMPNRVTKLTRAELVKRNLERCADEVAIGEDFQFSLCMLLDAQRVEIMRDYCPYSYYMNDASMTMKHDADYPDKIRIMRENLCRISDEKGIYDFKPQIWNDFLCLIVLHLKGMIYKQKEKPYREIKAEMKRLLAREDVCYALRVHTMDRLKLSEKIFLFLMKHRLYACIYAVIRLYFHN